MVNFDRVLNYILIILVMLSLLFTVCCVASLNHINQQVNEIETDVIMGWGHLDSKLDKVGCKLENAIDAITSSITDAVDTNANEINNKKGSITYASDMCYDLWGY